MNRSTDPNTTGRTNTAPDGTTGGTGDTNTGKGEATYTVRTAGFPAHSVELVCISPLRSDFAPVLPRSPVYSGFC